MHICILYLSLFVLTNVSSYIFPGIPDGVAAASAEVLVSTSITPCFGRYVWVNVCFSVCLPARPSVFSKTREGRVSTTAGISEVLCAFSSVFDTVK